MKRRGIFITLASLLLAILLVSGMGWTLQVGRAATLSGQAYSTISWSSIRCLAGGVTGLLSWGVDRLLARPMAVQPANFCPANMTSYWRLEESSGTNFDDHFNDDNDAECTSGTCPAYTSTGKVGAARIFDGVDDEIRAPVATSLDWGTGSSFSIEYWVKWEENGCNDEAVAIGRDADSSETGNKLHWWTGCWSNHMASFYLVDTLGNGDNITSSLGLTSTIQIDNGAWHHVVAVRDGSIDRNLLYVDGGLYDYQTVVYTAGFTSTTAELNIGYLDLSPSYHMTGTLDEVALYDRALGLSEIQNHFNSGAGKAYCNLLPTANPDTGSTTEDHAAISLYVLSNDSFAPDLAETLAITGVGAGSQGGVITNTLSVTSTPVLLYEPAPDFNGIETFTYTINDGTSGSNATATVAVTVTAVNDPPEALGDGFTKAEDSTATSLDLLANDEAANVDVGEPLTITLVGTATGGGNVVLAGDKQSVTYTPAADFFGTETFPYTMTDGSGSSSSATVVVTVTAVNDPPTADPDSYTLPEDSSTYTLTVLANDSFAPDSGETLSISKVGTLSAGGTITNSTTSLEYKPASNFNGSETFTYTVNDGTSGSNDTATVVVTVTAVNDPPAAIDDSYTKMEGSSNNSLPVLANDKAANVDVGEALTITTAGPASEGGSLSLSSDKQSVLYTPAVLFNGVETFPYTMTDGSATSSAIVTVTVTEYDNPPTAEDDTFTKAEDALASSLDVLANDDAANPDVGEPLTITVAGPASEGGSVNIAADKQSIRYAPAPNFYGTEIFTYTITDDTPGNTATAVVTVTVTPEIDSPAVVNPGAQSSAEHDAISLQIEASDPDILPPDSDTPHFTYAAAGLPEGLSIGPTGLISGTIGYEASPDSPYSVVITVTKTLHTSLSSLGLILSGSPYRSTAITFPWSVSDTNRAPVVTNPGTQSNQMYDTVALQIHASDADGDTYTFSATGLPAGLSISSGGLISGTISASAQDVYQVTVTATDVHNGTSEVKFTWYVGPINLYVPLLELEF